MNRDQLHQTSDQRSAAEWHAFLAQASLTLASSTEVEPTVATIVRLAVPALAQLCVLELPDDDGASRRVIYAGPAAEPPAALAAGADGTPDPAAVLPLVAHGRALGTLTLVAGEGRRFTEDDLARAADFAQRAALALDTARRLEQAQEALHAHDELLDMVAHDLKNPLTVIVGAAQLLRRRLTRPEPQLDIPTMTRRIEQVADAAIQMRAMLNDLVDLAHARARRPLQLHCAPADLVAIAQRAVAEYQHTTSRHELRVESALRELVGRWDRARLERVLANLLAGAIRSSPDGGEVLVRIARIEDQQGSWAELAVQDHGAGIPAADLPRIAERLRRPQHGGPRSIGLALVSIGLIVAQHGGTVDVASVEGQGATFTVRLPLR